MLPGRPQDPTPERRQTTSSLGLVLETFDTFACSMPSAALVKCDSSLLRLALLEARQTARLRSQDPSPPALYHVQSSGDDASRCTTTVHNLAKSGEAFLLRDRDQRRTILCGEVRRGSYIIDQMASPSGSTVCSACHSGSATPPRTTEWRSFVLVDPRRRAARRRC